MLERQDHQRFLVLAKNQESEGVRTVPAHTQGALRQRHILVLVPHGGNAQFVTRQRGTVPHGGQLAQP
jgi:hypothetical protein